MLSYYKLVNFGPFMTLGSEHNDNLIHRQEQICHLSRIYLAQSTFDIKHKKHNNEVKSQVISSISKY